MQKSGGAHAHLRDHAIQLTVAAHYQYALAGKPTLSFAGHFRKIETLKMQNFNAVAHVY